MVRKFSLEDAAIAFLWSGKDAEVLAKLFEASAVAGAIRGLERAKERYRELHSGGCRMFSQGESCECFLCNIDADIEVLELESGVPPPKTPGP